MTNVVYGKKIGMGEAYLGDIRRGVTKISLEPMTVSQIKTIEKDGYSAVQVGFGSPKKRTRRKARYNREITFKEDWSVGTVINPKDVISVGSVCNIQGTSKGKGFAGVVKRWNFAGGPRTHGQSDRLRAPGSIGQGTTPGRVHKGKKMAGRMGSDTVTMKNALVVAMGDDNTIWVTGPVPGARNSLVKLTVMDNNNDISLTYLSGGLPLKIVAQSDSANSPETAEASGEPVVETINAEVASDPDQISPKPSEGE